MITLAVQSNTTSVVKFTSSASRYLVPHNLVHKSNRVFHLFTSIRLPNHIISYPGKWWKSNAHRQPKNAHKVQIQLIRDASGRRRGGSLCWYLPVHLACCLWPVACGLWPVPVACASGLCLNLQPSYTHAYHPSTFPSNNIMIDPVDTRGYDVRILS